MDCKWLHEMSEPMPKLMKDCARSVLSIRSKASADVSSRCGARAGSALIGTGEGISGGEGGFQEKCR